MLPATSDRALTLWLSIPPLFLLRSLAPFVYHEAVAHMRGSCRYCQSGNRDSIELDGGDERQVVIRRAEGGSRERGHFVWVQEAYRCVVLSYLGVGLCLRFRSMGLDILEASEVIEESVGTLVCASHDANCGFGGGRLRCLRIFG